ncbi:MAG: hypothetical protein JXA52_00370, partial [Planctomycetes bacterium]|nr:hypothetical protein [Planctomycetota bacterium]
MNKVCSGEKTVGQEMPKELSRHILATGRILELAAIKWQGSDGSTHEWEAVNRVGDRAAVLI